MGPNPSVLFDCWAQTVRIWTQWRGWLGTRRYVESSFKAAKGKAGLDEYEVRSATGWYRHMTLALWTLALLGGGACRPVTPGPAPKNPRPVCRLSGRPEVWCPPESGHEPVPAECLLRGRTGPGLGSLAAAPMGGPGCHYHRREGAIFQRITAVVLSYARIE